MMATEATTEPIAKSSITPDHELNPTETASQDVVHSEAPLVNGSADKDEVKPDTDNFDSLVNSAEVSVSGGSDTEASKAETSKTAGDEKGHVRTASTVKKPTSFKPVSVNKTFLAAKGATPAIPSKLGDKAATAIASQPGASSTAARPRLVAKSGSGLRDSAPRASAAANGGKPGAAPDANAVWNKNRPAPPQEPKRFTDEELKQRYGIHLATRLQSDDPGKQANWADIDDDDDDWAPESIEWTDGTKITLPQADEAPAPSPEPIPATLKDGKGVETMKPKSPAPTQASASPTVKPSIFGGRTGLVLKGASEKPTLVAKPPGPPTPVKSPWAPLPPVDKATPIAIDIPQNQQQQSRFQQRDPHGFHGMPPPPAKEIAADDFSRSWREGANTSRELYNSQSGRYEPVNDNRRGSMRNDARGPQPAVLQRPSQGDGPAEPSAAFQTHRASGQDGAYGRRRTSSNVSGGSGNFVRRMSRGHDMPPPHEMLNVRRGSLAAVSDAPSSPRNFSPSGQNVQGQRGYPSQQQWQSRASPVISHPSPQSMHGQMVPPASTSTDNQSQPASAVYEDPLEVQKKIMRQTRELAIKRRQEEEAKEEAARKERIRIKLEAMGPPPETKKKASPQEAKVIPTQIQTRESPSDATTEAEVVAPEGGAAPEPTGDATSQPKATNSLDGKTDEKPSASEENRTNGIHQNKSPSTLPIVSQDNRHLPDNRTSQDNNRASQTWQTDAAPSSDRFKPWAPAPSQQTSSRNVWGPPTNDRTLGNGTFNPELSRVPDMHQSMRPGPIGPPNSNRNGQFQQGRGGEPYGSRPAPIGPPNRQPAISNQQSANQAAVAKSGWGSLPDKLAEEDAALHRQQELEDARKRELEAQGIVQEVRGPVIKDTWRQVSINEDGSRSKVQASHVAIHGKDLEEATTRGMFEEQNAAPRHQLDTVGSQQSFNDAWRSVSNINGPPPVRGSRFFPNNRDVRLEEQNIAFDRSFDRPGSPSPPPPTMDGHPAYDGDSARPHVSLPRPAPVVKLPPPTVLAPIGPPKPASFAAAVHSPSVYPPVNHNTGYGGHQNHTHQYQDVRRQEPAPANWQDRINSLIGRKNSPPKAHAFAVDSSSKNALELSNQQYSATVSLPSLGSDTTDDGSIESKPAAEECFEEQEMGSLPVIKVPHTAPVSAWQLAPQQPKSLPRKFMVTEATSIEPLLFPQQISNNTTNLHIKIPGVDYTTTVTMAVARQRSNPRSRGGSRGGTPRHASSSNPRGGRGRDGTSGFPSPSLDSASVSPGPNSSGRGNRGGRGGYTSNWNRHVSTPVHT